MRIAIRCFLVAFIYAAFDIIVSNAWLQRHPSMTSILASEGRFFCTSTGIWASKSLNLDSNKMNLKLLVIDHYDSFTFNLVDILAQYCVHPPIVIPADSASSWDEVLGRQFGNTNDRLPFDGIVLSPGPGHPGDNMCSLSRDCVRQNFRVPILGVCLGHQILGTVYGANVVLAPEPVHGQVRSVRLLSNDLFDPLWTNIAESSNGVFHVTRYHSLHVTELEGTNLTASAVSDDADSVLMAMRHNEHPHFGVQFHPESVGTNETGKMLLQNFVHLCANRKENRTRPRSAAQLLGGGISTRILLTASISPYSVYVHKVPLLPPNGANFCPVHIVDELLCNEPYTFWLDDSRGGNSMHPAISILGASRRRVEYWGLEKDKDQQGILVWNDNSLLYQNRSMNILAYLHDKHVNSTDHVTLVSFEKAISAHEQRVPEEDFDTLPFEFRGGHVGYLGYEIRHDTTQYHDSAKINNWKLGQTPSTNPSVPTAAFLWADKSFVYDHQNQEWYLVGVTSTLLDSISTQKADIFNWMRTMSERLQLGIKYGSELRRVRPSSVYVPSQPIFTPKRSRYRYNQNFAQCIDLIRQGESYELCLTNQLESQIPRSSLPFNLYKILRRRNPAPFSAYLHWNPSQQSLNPRKAGRFPAFAICCSSPERFASVKRIRSQELSAKGGAEAPSILQVEAKPIKGTIARILPSNGRKELTVEEQIQDALLAQQLSSSKKDRAENLMIVDLLRNDLSHVCETGSVHVSKLMDIETYATVHQMVSTIRGHLRRSKTSVDVLQACFPGGSMTGAPKIRTMELLDELEDRVCRGPYSGCLGYISQWMYGYEYSHSYCGRNSSWIL
jgi:para-aminobenzoate synthetase